MAAHHVCTVVIALLCSLHSAAGIVDDAADRRVLRDLFDATGGESSWYPCPHSHRSLASISLTLQWLRVMIHDTFSLLQVEHVCMACRRPLRACFVLPLGGRDVRDKPDHGHCTRRYAHTGGFRRNIADRLTAELARQSVCTDLAHHLGSL
jgi:hypothetical protein